MKTDQSFDPNRDMLKQLKKSNFYEMLDLKNDASDAQIKKSFKKLALKYHPDKNSASTSKQVFHRITQAYDTLSDPSKRNVYDLKQESKNSIRSSFSFSEFNFHPKDSSSFSRFQKQSGDFQKKFSQKYMQFKMNEKAREERQKMKQQNKDDFFNNNPKSNFNSFKKDNSKQSKQRSRNNQNGFKYQFQQSWEEIYKKYGQFTSSKKDQNKNDFAKRTSNRPKFEQYQNEINKKIRLQKQKEKVANNLRNVKIIVLLIVVWLAFSYFGPSMKGAPVYSMRPSELYKIPHSTKELESPFFVTEQYLERASSDDKFRQYLDRKVDLIYIKTLSRVCNTMLKKQEQLQIQMDNARSKKSKKILKNEIEAIDLSSCDKLHNARQKNPIYFRTLFDQASRNPTEQQML